MNLRKFMKGIHATVKKQVAFYNGKRSYRLLLSQVLKSAYASIRFAKQATFEAVTQFNNALTCNP